MHSNKFEAKFGEFLEAKEFEELEIALFRLVRAAFQAGWDAALSPEDADTPSEEEMAKIIPFHTVKHIPIETICADIFGPEQQ